MKSPLKTLLVSTPLLLGGLELGLRLAGYWFPDLGMTDRDTGWSLRPGASGLVRKENKQGVFVRINSDGLRDQEHPITKPPSTFRIAVVGDSTCDAMEVPLEKTFWSILGRELNDCAAAGASRIEVINFGVAGFSTAQELIRLRTKVWKYQPDLVLLAFSAGDVLENYRPLTGQPLAPHLTEADGQFAWDDSFRKLIRYERLRDFKARLDQHLRIVQLATELRQKWRPRPDSAASLDKVFAGDSDPDVQVAWRITEELIRLIHRETLEHGAKLWITTTSAEQQVYPDPRVRQTVAARLGVTDLFYAERRLQVFCLRENIPLITPADEMARHAEQHQVYLHGFEPRLGYGHWNEEGHRLAGRIIAGRLCRELR